MTLCYRSSPAILLCLLLACLIPVQGAQAQIQVDVGEIQGEVNDVVVVPVTLTNIPESGFTSFSFRVVSTTANLSFVGRSTVGTILEPKVCGGCGWSINNFEAGNNLVTAFGGSSNPVTDDGVLVFLEISINGTEGGAILQLDEMRINVSIPGQGAPPVPFEPDVPSSGLNVLSPPQPENDAYEVDEGESLTVGVESGVLANDVDPDGDDMTAAVLSGPARGSLSLDPDGSFVYTHDGSETTSDTFTYEASDGSAATQATVNITIRPVNDPPAFTQSMTDVTVDVGGEVTGQFAASDPDNASLTFLLQSGPTGASVDPLTGAFSWTASEAGVFPVQVAVSDGTEIVQAAPFTITAQVVETHSGQLLGFHQPTALAVSGFGEVVARFSESDNSLVVTGAYEGLTSSILFAQVGIGAFGQEGSGVLVLQENELDNASGSFEEAQNTFDLDSDLPGGVTTQDFIDAYRAGNVFVNIHTVGESDGELRGQLAAEGNASPSVLDVSAPFSEDVTGDPGAPLFDATWTGDPADPDGDDVRLLLLAGADDEFEEILAAYDVTDLATDLVSITVAEAAGFVDAVVGAPTPGAAATVYWVLASTDGASIDVGQVASTVLTRGSVTDTELDESVPGQFLLRGTYPNPFVDRTRIEFDLPEAADVEVRVMDMLGRTMMTVPARAMPAGTDQHVEVSASELSSGIYLYQVIASGATGTRTATGTMTLLK